MGLKITFGNSIDTYLSEHDLIYCSAPVSGNLLQDSMRFLGKVTEIGNNYVVTEGPTSAVVSAFGNSLINNNFGFFSKDVHVNESSLKGYYASVRLVHNSPKRTELFAISSEISPSSK